MSQDTDGEWLREEVRVLPSVQSHDPRTLKEKKAHYLLNTKQRLILIRF